MRLRQSAFFLVAIVAACGGNGGRASFDDEEVFTKPPPGGGDMGNGGFGAGAIGDIEVDPKNATIFIDAATNPATPATIAYKVRKAGKDLTADTTFKVEDPALGTFGGPTFTSALALPMNKMGVSTLVEATTPEGKGLGRLTIVKLRKTGAQRDFFFIVPFGGNPTPQNDVLKFSTNIKQVDVVFAMDTTASMGGSINNLKNALANPPPGEKSLLEKLQMAIPNVGLAVVDYRDYPTSVYGNVGDWPVKVRQKITTVVSAAQTAVNQYAPGGGNDLPESQIPAMQHILTGEALPWPGGNVAASPPTVPGTWGAVEFRSGSVPVIVNITDINWHGEGNTPYSFATPTMATLKPAFQSKNAFFVNVTSNTEAQADELSDATNSHVPPAAFAGTCGAGNCCTGVNGAARSANGPGASCRLNFLHSGGAGVSDGIVKAIQAISVGASYDVRAVPSNDPTNAKGVDATKFIKALRAMDEGNPANSCPPMAARDDNGDGIKETFVNVTVGTPVCFEVIPAQNTTVMPEQVAQFFNAFIDVIGVQGNIQLDKRTVLFLVPPKDPGVN